MFAQNLARRTPICTEGSFEERTELTSFESDTQCLPEVRPDRGNISLKGFDMEKANGRLSLHIFVLPESPFCKVERG